jgi:uncharacterized membrane protein YcaP (DUF421 family)
MNNILFDSWESLFRTVIISVLAYAIIVFLLRVSGKRTLSKMNAFDFIVTIALGSTLATVILNKNVALIDGAAGFFMLIFLQYITTYISVRSKGFNKLIKATPTLLLYKGKMLPAAMKKERINEDEIYSIVREKGLGSLEDVDAVILETDGSLTLIKEVKELQNSVMNKVRKPQDNQ